ncbi:hypothetical protein HDU77_011660, partial [Chytriomyces hyalinus]
MSDVKQEPAAPAAAETHVKGETIVSHSVLEETTVITETLEIERDNTHKQPELHNNESDVIATGNAEAALSQLQQQDPINHQEANANIMATPPSTEPAPDAPIDHTPVVVVAATTSEAPPVEEDDTKTTIEDTAALIASLRNQVAVLTAKNADLEARLALAEQS